MRVLLILILMTIGTNVFSQTRVHVGQNSSIRIDGYSNVKDFECSYTGEIRGVTADFSLVGNVVTFNNVFVRIPVVDLDCGNSRMNGDMMDMLKSDDHSHITVTLHTATIRQSGGTASITFNIAGVSSRETVEFESTKDGD